MEGLAGLEDCDGEDEDTIAGCSSFVSASATVDWGLLSGISVKISRAGSYATEDLRRAGTAAAAVSSPASGSMDD